MDGERTLEIKLSQLNRFYRLFSWTAAIVLILIFGLIIAIPYVFHERLTNKIEQTALDEMFLKYATSQKYPDEEVVSVDFSPFHSAVATIRYVKVADTMSGYRNVRQAFGGTLVATKSEITPRWELLVAFAAVMGMLLVGGNVFTSLKDQAALEEKPRQRGNNSSPIEEIAIDIAEANRRATSLLFLAFFLLVGGVVMAFIGIVVFFALLPENSYINAFEFFSKDREFTSSDLTRQTFLAFKSTAVLIFIEAIAWFLLRQYRVTVEDYKSFYRLYLHRLNYFQVMMLLKEKPDQKMRNKLIESLLAQDLSGKLKTGESTETIEAVRLIEQNFAEKILTALADSAKTSARVTRKLATAKAPK